MREIAFALICLAVPLQAAPTEFKSVGTFSNMRFTTEHQYGTSVQLWRQGTEIVGLLSHAPGSLQGDTPRGLLENVDWNPTTGALSFTVRLSLGSIEHRSPTSLRNDQMEWVRSRELFVFKGVLKEAALTGDYGIGDGFASDPTPARYESVILKKESAANTVLTDVTTLEEWKAKAQNLQPPLW